MLLQHYATDAIDHEEGSYRVIQRELKRDQHRHHGCASRRRNEGPHPACKGCSVWHNASTRLPMSSKLIIDVQTFLKSRGFDPGPLDGVEGPLTEELWPVSDAPGGLQLFETLEG